MNLSLQQIAPNQVASLTNFDKHKFFKVQGFWKEVHDLQQQEICSNLKYLQL
jgi:hypothetical protein